MNKVSKIISFVGLGLLCLSLILVKFNLNNLLKPFYTIGNETYEKLEYISYNDIMEIETDIKNDNIRFIPTDGNNIKITYYESKYDKYTITDNENILKINKKIKTQFFSFDFSFIFQDITMIIEIPEDMILNYDIKTSNGKINFSDLDIFDGKFQTSNSKIILENTNTFDDLELKTSNGNIEVSNFVGNNITIKTSNGKIYMEEVDADIIYGSTSNGKIELDNLYATKIDLKSSNGNIYLNNLDASIINLKSSNGRIEGTINGYFDDYQKDIRTSNARIEIDGYEYSKIVDNAIREQKLTLKTSNGKIDIDFNN